MSDLSKSDVFESQCEELRIWMEEIQVSVTTVGVGERLGESLAKVVEHQKNIRNLGVIEITVSTCLLYTSPSPRDKRQSRMPSSA